MTSKQMVLVSWCARNNDPYERDREGKFILNNGKPVPGPTLTLLFDQDSKYQKAIQDVVLLYNEPPNARADAERTIAKQTIEAIQARKPTTRCELHKFVTTDPTDHRAIYDFLQKKLPEIRQKYEGRELVIHISPGTPSMQTIWVLMAECGFIDPPFTVVKSYRPSERRGREAVVTVNIGIETFYKIYKSSQPSQAPSEAETILWDPGRFRSPTLIDLYAEARRFAKLRVPVLITGERGTGKTTLASWIRLNSQFCKSELNRSWASVPCGQYSAETMRSELFGYVRGAFTGAERDHKGLLKLADGDTLFLDEIGDISRDLQRLLIRALEEGTYHPLGSTTLEKSVFRLIAATNLGSFDLQERLDPDFYDRIRTLQLRMPPLRELTEDLPWLWASTYETALQRSGVSGEKPPLMEKHHNEVVKHLKLSRLEGNLRDLFRVANRLISALHDSADRLHLDDAILYALQTLEPAPQTRDHAHQVTLAFTNGDSLDYLLSSGAPLTTKEVDRQLHRFMASELRRIAQSKNVRVEELCDVSSRTLREWAALALKK